MNKEDVIELAMKKYIRKYGMSLETQDDINKFCFAIVSYLEAKLSMKRAENAAAKEQPEA